MATIPRMRRILIVFMLFLLPLQVSWGAIATYCKHETGVAAKHIGHHEHQHHAQNGQSDQKNSPTIKFDGDCGFCQFGSIGMMIMPVLTVAKTLPRAITPFHISDVLSSYRPDRPERPKWVRAA